MEAPPVSYAYHGSAHANRADPEFGSFSHQEKWGNPNVGTLSGTRLAALAFHGHHVAQGTKFESVNDWRFSDSIRDSIKG